MTRKFSFLWSAIRWAIKLVLVIFAVVIAVVVLALVAPPDKVREALKKVGKIAELVALAFPPTLPAETKPATVYWLDQNWTARDRYWFHHASQGTATFPVPYDWFVSLERPRISIGSAGLLIDNDYLSRFGFISSPSKFDASAAAYGYRDNPSAPTRTGPDPYPREGYPENPDGLPVGFAKLKGADNDPVTGERYPDQIGFTCAACHTGHIEYNNVSIRFDGGPAMINLGKLESAVGISMMYTVYDPLRFRRFAARVAERVKNAGGQPDDNETLKRKLKESFNKIFAERKWQSEILARGNVEPINEEYGEGFGRLDALNRIGNQVFFTDMLPDDAKELPKELAGNFWRQDAPVSFPPIWDVPWFLWAQYDASILNPPVRNAGEALGVKAKLNFPLRADDKHPSKNPLFKSSVDLKNLRLFETMLEGPEDAFKAQKFTGLTAPKWDDAAKIFKDDKAWQIDSAKAARGRALYRTYCFECHRGPVRDDEFDRQWPDDSFWKAANPNRPDNWVEIGDEHFFNVVQKPVADLGTDPQQSRVLTERKVYLPPYAPPYRKVNPIDDLNEKWKCGLPKDDGLNASFALALMAVVDRAIDQWFVDNPTPPDLEAQMRSKSRPNCQNPRVFKAIAGRPPLVIVPQYRARPLDGVWATAPYLHNGAVPTLRYMLVPQNMRPQAFCVGSRKFDPINVGLPVPTDPKAEPKDVSCDAGLTKFDTTQPGNSHLGHSFEGTERDITKLPPGIIGPQLSDQDRDELVEYLKTL